MLIILQSSNDHCVQVCKEPLFRGETAPADLHLLVCQTPLPTHTVVVGCRYISVSNNMQSHSHTLLGEYVRRISIDHVMLVYYLVFHRLQIPHNHILYTSSLI